MSEPEEVVAAEAGAAGDAEEFPADLLMGCIESGGLLRCGTHGLRFHPARGEPIPIAFSEVVQMSLGGRHGDDANRLDLRLEDGRTLTLLVVGRDRVASLVQAHRGWDAPDGEHRAPRSGV